MPETVPVDISRTPGATLAEFDPSPLTIASGDIVFWVNDDEKDSHKPQSLDPLSNAWMDFPIPKKIPGQPVASSNTVVFLNTTSAVRVVQYACELHPGETGTIMVEPQT